MKISCGINHERLALGFDDAHFIYIKGNYDAPSQTLFVKKEDFYGREDMTPQEKEGALKAIEAYNTKNEFKINIIDN